MGMQVSAGFDEAAPIIDMNTTPLIDVMLVLLIMFIITIPLQTHAVKLDLPQGPPPIEPDIRAGKNMIVVDPVGTVLWNGMAIDLPTLHRTLERTTMMTIPPELHIQPDPLARYERVDEVLAVTKRVGVTKMGFIGNERYRVF